MKKLTCALTGQELTVNHQQLQKLTEKMGSLEKVEKEYVGREARRLLKGGWTAEQIMESFGVEGKPHFTIPVRANASTSGYVPKLTCALTGQTLSINIRQFNNLVEKMGSPEKVKNEYVGREARNLLKQGYKPEEIMKMYGVEGKPNYTIPERKPKSASKTKTSGVQKKIQKALEERKARVKAMKKKVLKDQIVDHVAKTTGYTVEQVEKAADGLF